MPTIEQKIITSQADIHITESDGPGLPLLMLHGSGASRRVFEHQLNSPLAERHRLIALDLPGHGDSTDAADPAQCYTLPGLAAVVTDVLSTMQIDRVAIFGWSLGGHIAVEMLHRRPGVAAILLTGAPPVGHGPIAMLRGFHANWDMLLPGKEKFTERDIERWSELCYGANLSADLVADIRRADGRIRPIFSRSMMRGDGADQRRVVEAARVPIAVIDGEDDPIIRHSYVAGLDIPTLWDGHAHVLPGAGHAAFRDAPERFNALLMRFAADAESWREMPEELAARRA